MTWDEFVAKVKAERYSHPAGDPDTPMQQASRRSVLLREVNAFDRDHRGERPPYKIRNHR